MERQGYKTRLLKMLRNVVVVPGGRQHPNPKLESTRIIILGLDNAGKTSILRHLAAEDDIQAGPTQGVNIKCVQVDVHELTVTDIGGEAAIRQYWPNFLTEVDGLIFVVDSGNPERFEESREELIRLRGREALVNVPFLIFANKQDLPTAQIPLVVAEGVGLHTIRERSWQIQASSAIDGSGIEPGMTWILNTIRRIQN